MAEDDLHVVVVTDHLTPGLVGRAGVRYVSPAQEEDQARALIGVLIGSPQPPAGKGPWARAVAGGRRHIALRRAGGEEPLPELRGRRVGALAPVQRAG